MRSGSASAVLAVGDQKLRYSHMYASLVIEIARGAESPENDGTHQRRHRDHSIRVVGSGAHVVTLRIAFNGAMNRSAMCMCGARRVLSAHIPDRLMFTARSMCTPNVIHSETATNAGASAIDLA